MVMMLLGEKTSVTNDPCCQKIEILG